MRMKICTFVNEQSFYDEIDSLMQETYTSRRLHAGRPNDNVIIQLERDVSNNVSVITSHRKVTIHADESETSIMFLNNCDFLRWVENDMQHNVIRRN